MNVLVELATAGSRRMALPIAVYPGVALTGATVRDLVTNPEAQYDASVALHERLQTAVLLSAMDLSVEAEAFGCTISFSDDEVPTVTGSLVTSLDAARALPVPEPGQGRTPVYLETVRRLAARPGSTPVLAGCIGPFSLAARLVGVSEAMTLTLTDPDLMHVLLGKSAAFLGAYARAFRAAGARGLIMAEPAAGLLSPRALAEFSSAYVRRILEGLADAEFGFILHNCAAKLLHLPAVLESGARVFHFGAPMDLLAALDQVPADVILCGNLDPTAVFVQSSPEQIAALTRQRLAETRHRRNYVISSGCDVPARAPLANLEAFFRAVKQDGSQVA